MRINSVPDVKCFRNNKNVLRAQSIVWHFVHHPVCTRQTKGTLNNDEDHYRDNCSAHYMFLNYQQ